MIADPKATQARLDELATASAAAKALIDQATQAHTGIVAERAAHDQAISQERAAHDAALRDERARFEVECEGRDRLLTEREAKIGALEEKAKADAEQAAKLRRTSSSGLHVWQRWRREVHDDELDFASLKAQADAADPNLLLSLAEAAGNQMAAVTAIAAALNYGPDNSREAPGSEG